MKSVRLLALLVFGTVLATVLASPAFAQGPAITSVSVKTTGCVYKVGVSTKQCSLAPGMTLVVNGSNFGKVGGGIIICDCLDPTVVSWSPTRVVVIASAVTPNTSLVLETIGGQYSNSVPYTALAPLITSIVIGSCTYTPNASQFLCLIQPGDQVTINGSYFGPPNGQGEVVTCDCGVSPTIVSWDPDWSTNPTPYNNQIVIVDNAAVCGSTIAILLQTMWSNFVPYTAC